MSAEKPTKYEEYTQTVANLFIEGVENGTAPWVKPWTADKLSDLPHNPTTGKPYTRGNEALLNARQTKLLETGKCEDAGDNRWATYNQWASVGGQVRRGEKSTTCISKHFSKAKAENDLGNEKEEQEQQEVKSKSGGPGISSFYLFHASQVDGIEPRKKAQERPLDERIQGALDLVEKSGAKVEWGGGRAYYDLSRDVIRMPDRESFKNDMAYASTLLHELGHWTGNKNRLNRSFSFDRNSPEYAREELRAEMFSYMCAQRLGLDFDPDMDNHKAYVGDWVKSVKNDPSEIVKAARDADAICQHLNVPAPSYEKMPQIDREQKNESKKQFPKPPGPGSIIPAAHRKNPADRSRDMR